MTPNEAAMLAKIAEADEMIPSETMRALIREKYVERFGEKKPRVKRAPKAKA